MRQRRVDWLPWAIGAGGGVVFVAILAALYGGASLPRLPGVAGDPDQAKVLAYLRGQSASPNPRIEVVRWLPARTTEWFGTTRKVCWLDARIRQDDRSAWERVQFTYDVTGSRASVFTWGEDGFVADAQERQEFVRRRNVVFPELHH